MWVVFTQQKNGLPAAVLALDEVAGRVDELVVAGLHPLLGQRARVLDPLLADAAPARVLRRVVLVVAQQWRTPRGPNRSRNAGNRASSG